MSVIARCRRESRKLSRDYNARSSVFGEAHTPITVFTESDPTLSSLASAMSTILRGMPREAEIYRTVSQRRADDLAQPLRARVCACTRHACMRVRVMQWKQCVCPSRLLTVV